MSLTLRCSDQACNVLATLPFESSIDDFAFCNVAGRLDRKIEIPLPNEQGRIDILKIHAQELAKQGEIDYEAIVKLGEDFNGADLRNIVTEAGMFAIRDERDYAIHEDFVKAVRKIKESKKLESSVSYDNSFKPPES